MCQCVVRPWTTRNFQGACGVWGVVRGIVGGGDITAGDGALSRPIQLWVAVGVGRRRGNTMMVQ